MLIPYPHDRKYRNIGRSNIKYSRKEKLLNSMFIEFYTHVNLSEDKKNKYS